jgi:hypothetical protein
MSFLDLQPVWATSQIEVGGVQGSLIGADAQNGFGWHLAYGYGKKTSEQQSLYVDLSLQEIYGLSQKGVAKLGFPNLERNRLSTGLTFKSYRQIFGSLNLLLGIRAAYLFEHAQIRSDSYALDKDTNAFELGFLIGLQFRINRYLGIQVYWSPAYVLDREEIQLSEKDIGIEEENRHNGISRFIASMLMYF